jgi:hypothetical protein
MQMPRYGNDIAVDEMEMPRSFSIAIQSDVALRLPRRALRRAE